MSDPVPEALLDELRTIGDPQADDLVDALTAECEVDRLLALLRDLIRIADPAALDRELEGHGIDPALRRRAREFIERARRLPRWADPALIERGEALFRDHTFLSFVVLGCASLPACYCWEFEARILAITEALVQDVPRRIPETAQMVVDVMAAGGLGRDGDAVGEGIQAAQKVRLMHACIRRALRFGRARTLTTEEVKRLRASANPFAHFVHVGSARAAAGEAPARCADINQEQLAATLLTFSYVILDGYRRVGVRVSGIDERAYLHAWNVVGHLLGMDRRVLDALLTCVDAQSLFEVLMRRNCTGTREGQALVTALIDYMRDNTRRIAPLWFALGAGRFPRLIMSRLVHPATAQALALEPGTTLERVLRVPLWAGLRLLGWLKNFRLLQRLAEHLFKVLSKHLWDWRVAGDAAAATPPARRTRPTLPHALARHWNLS